MTLARNLVQGVDIWLNNPRRPLEASGTSGQKVAINGIINFSVLDGWWCEGYNGKTVGQSETIPSTTTNIIRIMPTVNQFTTYWKSKLYLLSLTEMKKVYPKVGKNNEGINKSIAAQYSTHRMVQDYIISIIFLQWKDMIR